MHSFISPHAISAYIIYKNKFLVIRQTSPYLKGSWQMVTGGLEEGEKAWEGALREIKRETGITPDRFYSADAVETFYIESLDKIGFIPAFVAVIDSEKEVILSNEYDAYEWLDCMKAKERFIWSEQKRIVQHIQEEFIDKKPSNFFLINGNDLAI